MAKQEVGLKIDVDVKSVGNMKQELRAATQELIAVNEKFGSTSTQAIEAAKRVASLKDAIGDAKALADTFNPDKKFVALGGAVQGAVAGFSALQGAIGLFGSESKDVEKILLKVQSAMALQQGISGVAGAMDSMKLLAGTIKTQVVTAFSTLRGAIIATGIGALGIAVALVAAHFEEFKKKIFSLIPGLQTAANFIGGLVTKFTDFVGITSEAERNLDKFTKANKRANEGIDAQIKLLEAQGGKEDQVYNLKKQRSENELNTLRESLKAKGKLSEEELKQFRDLKTEQQVLDIEEANRKKKLAEEDAKRIKDENDKKLAEQIRINEELRKERERAEIEYSKFLEAENERRAKLRMDDFDKERFEIEKRYKDQLAIAQKYGFDTSELERLRFNDAKDLINKTTEENKIGLDKQLSDFSAMIPMRATMQTTLTANEQTEANTRTQIAQEEVNNRIALTQSVGEALGALSNVVGQETAAGKALAIAQATINTFLGITEVWKSKAVLPEPFNTATKVAATITTAAGGFAAVKRISQTQIPGGRGGGGGVGNLSAPIAPALAPQVQATQVNTAAVNQMGNRAARAYVLNSDIQNDNQRNAYIERNASIG